MVAGNHRIMQSGGGAVWTSETPSEGRAAVVLPVQYPGQSEKRAAGAGGSSHPAACMDATGR